MDWIYSFFKKPTEKQPRRQQILRQQQQQQKNKIAITLGIELETQILSPIWFSKNRISYLLKEDDKVMKFIFQKNSEYIGKIYPDVFTKGYAFDDKRKSFLSKINPLDNSDLELTFEDESNVQTKISDIRHLFNNAEFVITFHNPKKIEINKEDFLQYLFENIQQSAKIVIKEITKNLKVSKIITKFPYSYFYSYPLYDYDQVIGYLSQYNLNALLSRGRFVPQCTFGIPINSVDKVLNILIEWIYPLINSEDVELKAMVNQYIEIETKTNLIMEMIITFISENRISIIKNLLLIFLYSTATVEARKNYGIVIFRKTCHQLIEEILDSNEIEIIKNALHHYGEYYFEEKFKIMSIPKQLKEARQLENLEDVQMNMQNVQPNYVYMEFRILGYGLKKMLRKDNLSLNTLSSFIK